MTAGPALLLLLLVPWPAAAGTETRYEKFQRQHVDPAPHWEPDPRVYCNLLMQRRNVSAGDCKELNSFIHGALAGIAAVCDKGGTPRPGNYRYSNAPFSVTDCETKDVRPPCNYKGSGPKMRHICLACDEGLPVHYAKPGKCGKKPIWGGD